MSLETLLEDIEALCSYIEELENILKEKGISYEGKSLH
jgi:hypothetical protein